MQSQDDRDITGNGEAWRARTGALGFAILFGFAAAVLALLLAPIAENLLGQRSAGPERIDTTITGSIGGERIYTIRRSVLQPSPESVCIIRVDGTRSGQC